MLQLDLEKSVLFFVAKFLQSREKPTDNIRRQEVACIVHASASSLYANYSMQTP
jgi:hypothetical protein